MSTRGRHPKTDVPKMDLKPKTKTRHRDSTKHSRDERRAVPFPSPKPLPALPSVPCSPRLLPISIPRRERELARPSNLPPIPETPEGQDSETEDPFETFLAFEAQEQLQQDPILSPIPDIPIYHPGINIPDWLANPEDYPEMANWRWGTTIKELRRMSALRSLQGGAAPANYFAQEHDLDEFGGSIQMPVPVPTGVRPVSVVSPTAVLPISTGSGSRSAPPVTPASTPSPRSPRGSAFIESLPTVSASTSASTSRTSSVPNSPRFTPTRAFTTPLPKPGRLTAALQAFKDRLASPEAVRSLIAPNTTAEPEPTSDTESITTLEPLEPQEYDSDTPAASPASEGDNPFNNPFLNPFAPPFPVPRVSDFVVPRAYLRDTRSDPFPAPTPISPPSPQLRRPLSLFIEDTEAGPSDFAWGSRRSMPLSPRRVSIATQTDAACRSCGRIGVRCGCASSSRG